MRLVAVVLLLLSSQVFAKESGKPFRLMIPVRFNAFGGHQISENTFDGDKKDFKVERATVGGDFNVPIPPIRMLVGFGGWFVLPESGGNEFLLVGPYLGYMGKRTDIFTGVAMGNMTARLTGEDAAPAEKIDLKIAMGCGFLGYRRYFGDGLTMGLGVTAFTCQASSYNKSTTTGLLQSETRAAHEAGAHGGMAYLMIAWREKRQAM